MKKNYFLLLVTMLIGLSSLAQLTAPFTEQFNTTSLPGTWNRSQTIGSGWVFNLNMGYAAAPILDHSGVAGSVHAWVDFSGSDEGVILQSDTIDITALTIPELNFYTNNNLGTNTLNPLNVIFVEAYNGTSWVSVDSLRQDNMGVWIEHFYNMTPYIFSGNKLLIRFRAEAGGSYVTGGTGSDFYFDLAIDDIGVVEFVPCRPVTAINSRNITSSSATVGWTTATGLDTAWIVEYGAPGFTQGTGTTVQVSVDSANITGLSAATIYEYYVTGLCSGDTTIAVGPNTFITACTAGLAGIYTLDPTLPSSTTNFVSFAGFFALLENCGVMAPTTLNVSAASAPYIINYDLSAFPGMSGANLVTINGNGSTVNKGVGTYFLALNGVENLTITDFNFVNETPTTTMFGIMMRNGCDSITIKNNTIDVGIGVTNFSSCGVCATNSLTSASTNGNNANNVTIDSNLIKGAYHGIRLNGVSTTVRSTGNKITNNTIEDAYVYSIYNYYQDDLLIHNNDISRPNRTAITTFYGVYAYYSTKTIITNNKIHNTGTGGYTSYPIQLGYSNNTVGNESYIVNNAIYDILITGFGTNYGIQLYSFNSTYKCDNIKIWHNTVDMTTDGSTGTHRGITTNTTTTTYFGDIDVTNNLVSITGSGTGQKHAIYFPVLTGFTGGNNLLYNGATAGTNNLGYYGANQATLAAWDAASSTTGNSDVNPSITTGTYIPLAGTADNGGTPLPTVPLDIDGTTRSIATPDFGAVEFLGLPGDISITNTWLNEASLCYGTSDSAFATIKNEFGSVVDFSVNNLTVNWTTTGPVANAGTSTINSGTLAVGADTTIYITSIDMSLPGTYTLSANIGANSVNASSTNDTLTDYSTFDKKAMITVDPKSDTVIVTTMDSVKISTQSPFYPGGAFFITEICHFAGASTGRPVSGKPSWIIADDYIEITGVPNSDLAGYTYERWSTSANSLTYTFPSGTILNANGTAIIGGGVATDVVNSYYGAGGPTDVLGSSTTQGHVLKDASGNVVDAVGYYNYNAFPAASGVTSSDWSVGFSHSSGTWGIRLTGADVNSATNWVICSNAPDIDQDPNTVNAGVTVPVPSSVAGLQWTDITNSVALDTTPEIYAKGWTTNGLYQYEATYTTPCGPFSDTSDIFVLLQTIDTVPMTVCDTFTTPLGGVAHTTSGIYSDTIMGTSIVYDSIIHFYNVTVNYMTTETIAVAICDSLQAPSGVWFSATGTYMDTIPNALGCDSVMTINLTITTTTFLRDTLTVCDSEMWRGMNLTTSGIYNDTIFTGSCDSIYVHNLTVNYTSTATFTEFVCDSMISPSGKIWNADGTYIDTIPNALGCDSIMTYNLTFGYISYTSFTLTKCDMYTSPSGKVWTTTGMYLDTIVNASGCDSAMSFNLTVNYSYSRTDVIALCAGIPHRVGPSLYTTAGTYTNVFSTSKGCDSTIITNLSYFAPANATMSYNFCTGDSVMVLGNWYYAATSFMDTIIGGSSHGCDSITTHNITTRTVSPALNLGSDVVACLDGGVTIFASSAYDTYNWSSGGTTNVLSNTGAMAGIGTTNHVLTVTQASSGCTATDDINITYNSCVGLSEVDADLNVNLYPNPATNFVTIEIFDKYNEGSLKLEILNSIGQVVTSKNITNSSEKVIMDVNNFSKGMYLVRISSDKLYMTKKLIIQK